MKIFKLKEMRAYTIERQTLEQIKERGLHRRGFPEILSAREGPQHCEILMEALGSDLKALSEERPAKYFSPKTCFLIGVQIVERLRDLHQLHCVHNDLKLENIITSRTDPKTLYLIDFGLTKPYVDEKGVHQSKMYLKKFSGNFLFASLNSCRGYNKSRRDDIESLFYVIIFLLNQNKLPWSDFDKQ